MPTTSDGNSFSGLSFVYLYVLYSKTKFLLWASVAFARIDAISEGIEMSHKCKVNHLEVLCWLYHTRNGLKGFRRKDLIIIVKC